MFEVSKLTLGEVATIEKLADISISQFAEETAPKGKALAAMVFVIKRRELLAEGRPVGEFKFPDALALPFDEARSILGMDDDDDNTEGTDDTEGTED